MSMSQIKVSDCQVLICAYCKAFSLEGDEVIDPLNSHKIRYCGSHFAHYNHSLFYLIEYYSFHYTINTNYYQALFANSYYIIYSKVSDYNGRKIYKTKNCKTANRQKHIGTRTKFAPRAIHGIYQHHRKRQVAAIHEYVFVYM